MDGMFLQPFAVTRWFALESRLSVDLGNYQCIWRLAPFGGHVFQVACLYDTNLQISRYTARQRRCHSVSRDNCGAMCAVSSWMVDSDVRLYDLPISSECRSCSSSMYKRLYRLRADSSKAVFCRLSWSCFCASDFRRSLSFAESCSTTCTILCKPAASRVSTSNLYSNSCSLFAIFAVL